MKVEDKLCYIHELEQKGDDYTRTYQNGLTILSNLIDSSNVERGYRQHPD